MGKTVRFGDLVRESGRPHAVTLWVDPKRDPAFSKAVRENRVLTIHTNPAGKRKEHGEIGFHQRPGNIYLVFPRPTTAETDGKIVGINYQLTEEPPAPKGRIVHEPKEKPEPNVAAVQTKPPEPKPKPVLRHFEIVVRRTATLEDRVVVEAESNKAAREQAMTALKPFDGQRAAMRTQVLSVKEKAHG